MASISYAYRVGHNIVSKIISETCKEIWNVLKETVFVQDNSESWQEIADEFEQLWNYPNCIACIDRKYVRLQVSALKGWFFIINFDKDNFNTTYLLYHQFVPKKC